MKIVLLLVTVATALGCGNSTDIAAEEHRKAASAIASSENTASEETLEEQETMLTGRITREDLLREPYKEWFDRVYESYEPSEKELATIENNIHNYEIEVIMGIWCPDSRREVPKLLKLLEIINYDLDDLDIIAVGRNKGLPENVETTTEFEMVPTIIFSKEGKEVNRFVEFSQESFEEDIAKIVSGEEYSNPYAE